MSRLRSIIVRHVIALVALTSPAALPACAPAAILVTAGASHLDHAEEAGAGYNFGTGVDFGSDYARGFFRLEEQVFRGPHANGHATTGLFGVRLLGPIGWSPRPYVHGALGFGPAGSGDMPLPVAAEAGVGIELGPRRHAIVFLEIAGLATMDGGMVASRIGTWIR